ncbi:esterase-like activity of phytase family protein (plasmid) [Caballeronia sp. NK8]|uniref:esterase-like activity of phytase family protein n=1 Tax=Caballeronia sp. NK8 TaxID=140098 RepID=UPI001BB6F853|nr:esterase-like activity of phytase family protein [Caballeronia sp. NK8]BCQ27493.1 esterase-like activity of phytase family protein [Caballeronia sp. NK8]
MIRARVCALSLALSASVVACSSAWARVDLIAIGELSGLVADRSKATAAPLENGAPGNLLGGLGSGLAYAGCDTFLATPDRGPNAISYNKAIDDTASYINRFQTLILRLEAGGKGDALPYALNPKLVQTTLLHAREPLVYGDGAAYGVPDGAPALNEKDHTHYFTGRSDNFTPTRSSTFPLDARFDPESIRVARDGASVFISDEYGPYLYRFDRRTGERVAAYRVPASFAVTKLAPVGNDEISENTSGRVANKGMEGLAISPDGDTLFGAMQSPLIQDGGTNGAYTRILRIDLRTGKTAQFAYPLTNLGTDAKPNYPTISDIVAVSDHELLVDERDGKGLGDDSAAVFKRVFHVDLAGAQDVSQASGEAGLKPYAIEKTLFLDVVKALSVYFKPADIPAKIESLAFGPDVRIGGKLKHTLFIANDNDFLGTVTDTNHPNGIDNPNRFFVFAIDPADLPGYVAQRLPGADGRDDRVCRFAHDGHGHDGDHDDHGKGDGGGQ